MTEFVFLAEDSRSIAAAQIGSEPQAENSAPGLAPVFKDRPLALNSPIVFGRSPERPEGVAGGHEYLQLAAESFISRIHFQIERHGADTFVTDLSSANGTVIDRDGESWLVPAGEATVLQAGDVVRVGEHAIRIEPRPLG